MALQGDRWTPLAAAVKTARGCKSILQYVNVIFDVDSHEPMIDLHRLAEHGGPMINIGFLTHFQQGALASQVPRD